MKNAALIIILLGLFGLQACKEYEPSVLTPEDEAIFYVNGSVDFGTINLRASGDYRATSQTAIDSLDVTYYGGQLHAEECTSCTESFELRWRSNNLENPAIGELANINPAYRLIHGFDTIVSHVIKLNAITFGLSGDITWTVLGEEYTGESIEVSVPEDYDETEIPVFLEATYSTGCSAQHLDTVYLPSHGCTGEINPTIVDTNKVIYNAVAKGGDAYRYTWNFSSDSSISASSATVEFYYDQLPADGIEEVRLQIETGDCRATTVRSVVIEPTTINCAVDFTSEVEIVTTLVKGEPQIDLTEIELVYTDKTGNTYSSYVIEQPTWSSFDVISFEDFVDPFSSDNQPSKKINAEFNCLLSDGANTIEIRDAELVLPIGLGAD